MCLLNCLALQLGRAAAANYCPLTVPPVGSFLRSGLTDGTLTFEDAPPKSYGGKPVALTCKPCNHSLGSAVDASLARFRRNIGPRCAKPGDRLWVQQGWVGYPVP